MVDKTETIGGAIEDVRAFCTVVELGTVSAAARQLQETKGSISRRLSRLEKRLAARLLARTPRAVSPTEEGTAFYTKAREALKWMDDAAEGARQSQDVLRGHLRVTAPIDLGMDVLPDLVVRFRRVHPQINVELLSGVEGSGFSYRTVRGAKLPCGQWRQPGRTFSARHAFPDSAASLSRSHTTAADRSTWPLAPNHCVSSNPNQRLRQLAASGCRRWRHWADP